VVAAADAALYAAKVGGRNQVFGPAGPIMQAA
jgi:PleD family two-component response regulator